MHFLALILASFLFSDIPWNTPGQAVQKKLIAAGFKVSKKPDKITGDYQFRGEMLGHPANGVASLANGKLARIIVTMIPGDESLRDTYTQIRNVLVKKYGTPEKTVERYLEPFHEGDGYEMEAIRAGKAQFATRWLDSGETLVVNITPDLNVAVTYESPDWAAESARRMKATF